MVPRLAAGDRFLLRPWELGDLPLVREASSDDYIPLITTVPATYSREAGEAFVRRQWERASTGNGYPFVIVRIEDGRPLGMVGLWLKDRGERRASLGYWRPGRLAAKGLLTIDHIEETDGAVRLRLGAVPVDLPGPVAELALQQVAVHRSHAALARTDSP